MSLLLGAASRRALCRLLFWILVWAGCFGTGGSFAASHAVASTGEEFIGPFASWLNAKADFKCKGDGVADDTAALQRALDALRPYDGKGILYIPAGTYLITGTLYVRRSTDSESKDISILGEDPATTRLRWDGPTNGTMLNYGAWYAKMGRLTFDGAGVARTGIAHGSGFSTHNEFSDIALEHLAFGIEAGTPDGQGNAETVVRRCTFTACAKAGVSLQNWNSLDWFFWDCEFNDCGFGVANVYGAGNFHVYRSLFRNSSQADVGIGNTGFFSIRNNISIGSKAFFTAAPMGSCGLVTLQGNTILKPAGVPVQIHNRGPLLLLDNFVADYHGCAANLEPSSGMVAVGNTLTVANAIQGPQKSMSFDNVIAPEMLTTQPFQSVRAPSVSSAPIIELSGELNADGIRSAINRAAALSGRRPIVHLRAGVYLIDRTITIPAGSDVQIAGDGGRTQLRWAGGRGQPVMHLEGPTRATLRDFALYGDCGQIRADGILVDNCDQSEARICGDQVEVSSARETGLSVENLADAAVSLTDFYHSENHLSVRVEGTGQLPTGTNLAGRVAIFGGASAGNDLTYEVTRGASLLVRDMWYESVGQNQTRFMRCTDSGCFTLHGANIAPKFSRVEVPTVEIVNFAGQLSFLGTQFSFPNTSLALSGEGRETGVMLLGTLGENEPAFHSSGAQTAIAQSFKVSENGSKFARLPDEGVSNPEFLRRMLGQTRTENPLALGSLPAGTTDLRIFRVFVRNCRVGIEIRK
jgi:hypothetical protein